MNSTSTKNNQGFVTLTISLILLIAVTLISMFSVKSISLENKIANNSYRSDIALQAAEASVASAFNYLSVDPDVDGDNAIDSVFDTDGDGIGDNNEMGLSGFPKAFSYKKTRSTLPLLFKILVVAPQALKSGNPLSRRSVGKG